MPEETQPPVPAGDAAPTSSPGGPAAAIIGGVAVAILLLAALTMALLQWQRANDLADEDERVAAASLAAGSFVTELLGYDHRDLEGHEAAVIAAATERFVTDYQRALDGGLRENIRALEAVASVTVREVFVAPPDAEGVEAVVIVDTEVTSRTGTRRLVGAYLQVSMLWDEDAGIWLVDEVTSVATLDEILTPPDGEAQTEAPPAVPSPAPTGSPSADESATAPS